MQVYTLKEAARKAKIGEGTLKRACEEGLIKASRLPNRQWIIAESALEEAMHQGIDLRAIGKSKGGKKQAQPEHLRKYQEGKKKAAKAA